MFQFVRGPQEKSGRFPVSGNELPYSGHLGTVQLVVQQRRLLQHVRLDRAVGDGQAGGGQEAGRGGAEQLFLLGRS